MSELKKYGKPDESAIEEAQAHSTKELIEDLKAKLTGLEEERRDGWVH